MPAQLWESGRREPRDANAFKERKSMEGRQREGQVRHPKRFGEQLVFFEPINARGGRWQSSACPIGRQELSLKIIRGSR